MVIDAAKGIEARTRKLFEVCRLRDIPIITFINKMDRESRDPFELLDEIEKTLALDTAPMTWPIGRGRDFAGTYDIATGEMRLVSEDGKTVRPRCRSISPRSPPRTRCSTPRPLRKNWRWSRTPAAASISSRSARAI